jgi:GDP-L-fucose synthase
LKRVLLTGGRGFFGRRIAESLSARGYDVSTPGRPEFELTDRASVDRTMRDARPEIVVHSAAYYGGLGICMNEPAELFHTNVVMLAHVLDSAAKAGAKRFVSIGSACAYPGQVAGDMRESDYWSGALHPSVAAYGFSKKVQEVGVRSYAKQYGLTGQFPIVTNLYGEHDVFGERRSHVAAALIKKFSDAWRAWWTTATESR